MMSKILRNTWKNIRRMPYQALSAIAVLTITFAISQLFTLLTLGSQQILKYFETRPQVSAYFTDDTKEEEILNFKTQLEEKTYVMEVTYISKEEALSIYREQNKDDPLLLEMVTADILPASLEVSPSSADDLPQIQDDLNQLEGTEEVVYQQDVIAGLIKWTRGIRLIGLGLIGFLIATSILIIVVIIGMKVATRRQEIAIMQLLGAKRWYIIGPFLVEGAFYGFIGAFISWLLAFIVLLYTTPLLVEFLGEIPLLPIQPLVIAGILGTSVVLGIVIGMLGSGIAVRRYFK